MALALRGRKRGAGIDATIIAVLLFVGGIVSVVEILWPLLLIVAAVLLPVDVALRKLRLSPADLLEWLRHPRRVTVRLPGWSPELPTQMPSWAPGKWSARRTPPAPLRRIRAEPSFRSQVTPGLARETQVDGEADEDDALGATLRWLAARRGGSRNDPG